MNPTIANIVVQIAAESETNQSNKASQTRVIAGLQSLGFEESRIRATISDAESLGFVRNTPGQFEIVGAE